MKSIGMRSRFASVEYASAKAFFSGQNWPIASRRVADRSTYSFTLVLRELNEEFALVKLSHHCCASFLLVASLIFVRIVAVSVSVS